MHCDVDLMSLSPGHPPTQPRSKSVPSMFDELVINEQPHPTYTVNLHHQKSSMVIALWPQNYKMMRLHCRSRHWTSTDLITHYIAIQLKLVVLQHGNSATYLHHKIIFLCVQYYCYHDTYMIGINILEI